MSRTRTLLAVSALLFLAIGVRFVGLDYLLPSLIEPDAHIMVQVELIEQHDPEPSESIDWGKYPHLVAWATIALTPNRPWGSLEASAPIAQHIALSIAKAVRVRWTVALLSLTLLPITWLVARFYLPRGWRLLAVAFVATSLLAVHFATQGRPHGAAAGLPALAVVACVLARRKPTWFSYGLAAGACGLALAGLQSGVAAFIPFGVAHLLGMRGRGWRQHLLLILPLVAFAIALYLFYPFWFEGSEGGRVELEGTTLDQAGHKINLGGFNGKSFAVLLRGLWSWEPALMLAAGLGLVAWLVERVRRRPPASSMPLRDHLVVLSYALSYAFVIGLYHRSYERFLLPLLPFLAVLAAFGLWRLWCALPDRRRPLALLVTGAWLVFPTLVVVQLARLRTRPDTFDQAVTWIAEQVEPGAESIALSVPLILPLYRTPASIAADRRPRLGGRMLMWIRYQELVLGLERAGPAWDTAWLPTRKRAWRDQIMLHPRQFVRSLPEDFCVIEVFEPERIHPIGDAMRRALDEDAELLARFSPDADRDAFDTPLVYQDETGGTIPLFAWRLLHAERLGPVLHAYRLPGRPPG